LRGKIHGRKPVGAGNARQRTGLIDTPDGDAQIAVVFQRRGDQALQVRIGEKCAPVGAERRAFRRIAIRYGEESVFARPPCSAGDSSAPTCCDDEGPLGAHCRR
jgi:hypothetical protein